MNNDSKLLTGLIALQCNFIKIVHCASYVQLTDKKMNYRQAIVSMTLVFSFTFKVNKIDLHYGCHMSLKISLPNVF